MAREDDTFESGWAAGYLRGISQAKPTFLDKETITLIICSAVRATKERPSDAPELIARNIATADQVAAEIFAAEEEIREAEIAYHEARYEANEKKNKARESCAHWATKPIDFPDDYDFCLCLICGAEV